MIVCADDYGLAPGVSEGIIELIGEQRISATSCVMVGPFVDTAMNHLHRLQARVDVGLHLVLTFDRPLTALSQKSGLVDNRGKFHSFSHLLMNAYMGSIKYDAVLEEIDAQVDRFKSLMGHPPQYIDGHQHIQQLPVIRDAVAKAAHDLAKSGQSIYVRVAALPAAWLWTKALRHSRKVAFGNCMIALPGKTLEPILNRAGIPHNRYLLGYYDYEGGETFEAVVQLYLTLQPNATDILFCHPGYVDDELRSRDPLVDSRMDVLQFLGSSRWEELMNQSGTRLTGFFRELT